MKSFNDTAHLDDIREAAAIGLSEGGSANPRLLDDISDDGMRLIEQICTIFREHDLDTQGLLASVRSPEHLVRVAVLGSHLTTMPSEAIRKIASRSLTVRDLEQFMADWEKVGDWEKVESR